MYLGPKSAFTLKANANKIADMPESAKEATKTQ